jgi:hypothetical protein
MQGHHYLTMALLLIAGYVIARYWPAPGQMVGLP